MNKETIFWYDLESFGLNTAKDRIAQAAGLRTDLDLNIIGEELNIVCKITPDYLPNPGACLVTKITPQDTLEQGLNEADFIKIIRDEFMVPNTTVTGFNNISYDDELIRHTLYRNLYNSYEREYGDGRSRWDVLNLARAIHDLRPEGINFFHRSEKNHPQVKLTYLTEDNNIEQIGAHDALVDIYATINFAKLVKEKQPKMYDFYYTHRQKNTLVEFLKGKRTVLLTTGFFTNEYGFTRPIALITTINDKTRQVYYFDLTQDASKLLEPFTSIKEVPGLSSFQLNKCPYLAPISILEKEADVQKRLNIDMDLYRKNMRLILENPQIENYINSLDHTYLNPDSEKDDIDYNLYSSPFLTYEVVREYNKILKEKPENKIASASASAKEKTFRLVARNWPEALTGDEKIQWNSFIKTKLENKLADYFRSIEETPRNSAEDKEILDNLTEYGKMLEEEYKA